MKTAVTYTVLSDYHEPLNYTFVIVNTGSSTIEDNHSYISDKLDELFTIHLINGILEN